MHPTFNGVSNYVRVFTNSAAAISLKNLLYWSIIAMTLHVGFGVLVAFVLYHHPKGWKFCPCGLHDSERHLGSGLGADLPLYL